MRIVKRCCATCRYDLGGGFKNCRINLEDECGAGGFEAWEEKTDDRSEKVIDGSMLILCREVNKRTGEIMVYEVKKPVTNDLLVELNLRTMLNPELRYFCTPRVRWDGIWHDDYYKLLKKRNLTDELLEQMGGIIEIRQ